MATTIRTISLETVLQPETVAYLEQAGLISAPLNNKRKLSTSALFSSSSRAKSQDVTPPAGNFYTPLDFQATHISIPEEVIEIPINIESKETLEFIGYTPAKAAEIWKKFCSVPDDEDSDFDFLPYALEVIDFTGVDAYSLNDDWEQCLATYGINDKLSAAIMLEEYSDLRCTDSCSSWVKDSLEGNYRSLEEMDKQIQANIAAGKLIRGPALIPTLESRS